MRTDHPVPHRGIDTIRTDIELLVRVHGSLRAVARHLNIDVAPLSRVMSGSTPPSPQVLSALGFRKRVVYEREGL